MSFWEKLHIPLPVVCCGIRPKEKSSSRQLPKVLVNTNFSDETLANPRMA